MSERPLRILQVNTFDVEGGSARIARDLAAAYRARGHASWMAVGNKLSDDPDVLTIPNDEHRGVWSRFWRSAGANFDHPTPNGRRPPRLTRMAGGLAEPLRLLDMLRGFEEFDYPGTGSLTDLSERSPDIIHGHNLHGGYFDLRALPSLSSQLPLVLTLHDAWLLSGHCAHSFDCNRWTTGCGQCPDLTIYPAIRQDGTNHNWRRKRQIYLNSRLAIATPSQWLMDKVERSILAPAIVDARVIPNGVDQSVFRIGDMAAARVELGIRQDTKVLLFTANQARQNRWKDYQTLIDAVVLASKQLSGHDILFLVLGEQAPPERIGPVEVRFLGYEDDARSVARYYQAADIYVHAAHVDTFPCTILEAMACGKPVVATAVGGIPEQIAEGRTGFLVPPGDSQAFAHRLTDLLTNDALRHWMGAEAAASVDGQFTLGRQVDNYIQWYRELIDRRKCERERVEKLASDRDLNALPTFS